MKDLITIKQESIEDVISAIISLSSITGIDHEANVTEIEYHRGHFLKSFKDVLISKLKKKLPKHQNSIEQVGNRIVSNLRINVIKDHFVFSSFPHQGKIVLLIDLFQWGFYPIKNKNFELDAEQAKITDDLKNVYEKVEAIMSKLPDNFSKTPEIFVPRWEGNHVVQVRNLLTLQKLEDVSNYVDNMVDYIVEMVKIWPEMEVIAKKYQEFYK